MTRSPNKLIPADFPTVPGIAAIDAAEVLVGAVSLTSQAIGIGVAASGEVPQVLGFDREGLSALGFDGAPGSTLLLPRADGPDLVAVGMGDPSAATAASFRDAAAAVVRAAGSRARIGLRLGDLPIDSPTDRSASISALVEGALLARYKYTPLLSNSKHVALDSLEIEVGSGDASAADDDALAVTRARVAVRAAVVARDLVNAPPGHLTATNMGDIAVDLGERYGFAVETYGKQQLIDMGCGGLLGVNQGSEEEPRMIVLRYTPTGVPTGKLGLVGKGIMYDSGGISLKPSDPMHLLMKMDMGGAAAVLGAFTGLRDLSGSAEVIGWLMCTDNMPSATAYKLGDVLTARDGTTIEVKNTDAEGRLVMSDGFALANEEGVDAIIDIATLTGAALVSLGSSIAALLGNNEQTIDLVRDAAAITDEQVWQLPLERKYRKQLNSDIADIANLGGPFAGSITAALFLDHFAKDTPWAHLDIAGTMQSDTDDSWRSKGGTGYGARLLLQAAAGFTDSHK